MSIVDNNAEQDIVDIELAPIRKKKFRIDGDNKRVIELNTTDMGVVSRLNEIYPKMQELEKEYADTQIKFDEDGNITEDSFTVVGEAVKDLDTKMRDFIDYVFDSEVSSKCAPSGTMFDPINGSFRFEYILDFLGKLYEQEINENIKKRNNAMSKHTSKYTKSKTRKK